MISPGFLGVSRTHFYFLPIPSVNEEKLIPGKRQMLIIHSRAEARTGKTDVKISG